MQKTKKKIQYPENLYLQEMRSDSGISVTKLAEKLHVSRLVVSNTLNGHYKGKNIIPRLLEIFNPSINQKS
jgi:DNA transposition AAA+ family ATPase